MSLAVDLLVSPSRRVLMGGSNFVRTRSFGLPVKTGSIITCATRNYEIQISHCKFNNFTPDFETDIFLFDVRALEFVVISNSFLRARHELHQVQAFDLQFHAFPLEDLVDVEDVQCA